MEISAVDWGMHCVRGLVVTRLAARGFAGKRLAAGGLAGRGFVAGGLAGRQLNAARPLRSRGAGGAAIAGASIVNLAKRAERRETPPFRRFRLLTPDGVG